AAAQGGLELPVCRRFERGEDPTQRGEHVQQRGGGGRDEPRIERAPQRLVFEQRGLMLCVQEALEEGGRALWRLAGGEPTREHPLKRLVGERPPLEGLR